MDRKRIEDRAPDAATAIARQIQLDFENGKYPGLCDGAAAGTCTHKVTHVLPSTAPATGSSGSR